MEPYSSGWSCSECDEDFDDYDEAEACCDPEAQARLEAEKARRALEAAGQQRLPMAQG